MKTKLIKIIFLLIPFHGISQEYFKDTLHCGCIFKLHSISKDQLGTKVYIGKVIIDVNGKHVDYGPGFSSTETFYSAVPTKLPSPKKHPVLARPQLPGKNIDVWQGNSVPW
jgi:hypothetical protein